MICPVCKIQLDKAILHNVEVDYCPQCLGLWFDQEELRWAKDEKDRNLKWLDIDLWKDKKKFKIGRGIRLCPFCRFPLYEVYYGPIASPRRGKFRSTNSFLGKEGAGSGVVVDVCNLCQGIWLDRGEFQKIIEYLKRKDNWEILNSYAKNLKEEFWEIFTGPEAFREEILDFLTILKLLNHKFLTQHQTLIKLISNLPLPR